MKTNYTLEEVKSAKFCVLKNGHIGMRVADNPHQPWRVTVREGAEVPGNLVYISDEQIRKNVKLLYWEYISIRNSEYTQLIKDKSLLGLSVASQVIRYLEINIRPDPEFTAEEVIADAILEWNDNINNVRSTLSQAELIYERLLEEKRINE